MCRRMKLLWSALVAICAVAAPAVKPATAGEGSITDLVPADVGADGEFEVLGSGLALPGLTATLLQPVLNRDGSVADYTHMPLTVVAVADDRVALRVRRARPGKAFVKLTGADGAQSITTTLALAIRRPQLGSAVSPVAAPDETVVLAGAWLGGGGTLLIGGVRSRVETWTPDAITAVVPTRLAEGIHAVEVRNKVGRSRVTGVVEVRNGVPGARARCVVRERRDMRSYFTRSVTYTEATGALEVYASRTGPIHQHEVPSTIHWVPGYIEIFPIEYHPGHWEGHRGRKWTTQSVREFRLTATGATFDATGRAVSSACSLSETSHRQTSDRGATNVRERVLPTGLVVALQRGPDGTLSGSFSGQRRGRLVEGTFQQ